MARKNPLRPATTYPALVGAVLVSLREQVGLTQADLADRMDCAHSTWCRVEGGTGALTVEQLGQVAAMLRTPPSNVLTRADRARAAAEERSVYVAAERLTASEAVTKGFVLLPVTSLRMFLQGDA